MSATKRKSYNSLDKEMKEDDDETKTLEMEEGGISKAKDEEKQIQNLLDDTDQLIGNKKSHENNDDVDMNEIKPLINNKKEKDDYDAEVSFCTPNTIWGFTPNAWRSIFTFIMPLLHVLFTTEFLYGPHPVGNHPNCLKRSINSSWPAFTFTNDGNTTATDNDKINAEIKNQLGNDLNKLEHVYGKQTVYEEYIRFALALGCLHLIIGAYDLIMCSKPNGDIFTILKDCLLECFCGCTRYFICADDLSGKSATVFGCDRRNCCCKTTCLCFSPIHRCIHRLYSMLWLLPRWSIVIGALLELVCNGFFIFENPMIVGTTCFSLRLFAIGAIVINASLQGYKLQQPAEFGSALLPDESLHIVHIDEADNILRPKVRGTGLFFCC